jgi:hypothetical protein
MTNRAERAELTVYREIRRAFAAASEKECQAALVLLKARAKTLSLSFPRYVRQYHPYGFAVRDDNLPSGYNGYTEFLHEDSRAIIRAGKQANFGTFVHETAHIFRRQLQGPLLQEAQKAFRVENNSWTPEQENLFAHALSEYLRSKFSAPGAENVMRSGAEYVQNVFNGLDHVVNITPGMRRVFDRLFENAGFRWNRELFDTQLRSIKLRKLPESSHIFLGVTPPLYQEIGFEPLPLMITGKHLFTAMNAKGPYPGNYHNLGEDIIRQIPEQLKKPILVIQSKDSPGVKKAQDIVSIVELRDKDGNPVIVPIAYGQTGRFNNIKIDINLAKTIYGKDNSGAFISAAIAEGRLLYADKKRSRIFLSPGVQFPHSQEVSGFYYDNIARYKETVKSFFRNHPEKPGDNILFKSAASGPQTEPSVKLPESSPDSVKRLCAAFAKDPYKEGVPVPPLGVLQNDRSVKLLSGYSFLKTDDAGGIVTLSKISPEGKIFHAQIPKALYEKTIENSSRLASFAEVTPEVRAEYERMSLLDRDRTRPNTADNFWHNYRALCRAHADNPQDAVEIANSILKQMTPYHRRRTLRGVKEYEFHSNPRETFNERLLNFYQNNVADLPITDKSIREKDAYYYATDVIEKKGDPIDPKLKVKIGDSVSFSISTPSYKLPGQKLTVVSASEDLNKVVCVDEKGTSVYRFSRDDFVKQMAAIERKNARRREHGGQGLSE